MVNRVLYRETQAEFSKDVEKNIVYQKMINAAQESLNKYLKEKQ